MPTRPTRTVARRRTEICGSPMAATRWAETVRVRAGGLQGGVAPLPVRVRQEPGQVLRRGLDPHLGRPRPGLEGLLDQRLQAGCV